jgi:hypothetical protein
MKSKPSKPFSFNFAAEDFVPSFSEVSSALRFDAGIAEFIPLEAGTAEFIPLEAGTAEFIPLEAGTAESISLEAHIEEVGTHIEVSPVEETKTLPTKQYSRSKLLELKEFAKILAGFEVPENYSTRRKGKRSQRPCVDAITRSVSVFESSTILKKVENSFASSVKTTTDEFETTVRKVRATLNKLSPQNFDRLSEKILSEFDYTPELLERLVGLVFERVTAQHSFIEMYTRLCKLIIVRLKDKDPAMSRSFRTSLLTKSEQCFYGEEAPQSDSSTMDAVFRQRRRLVGNSKFICQLYLMKMLKDKHMLECFEQLLSESNLSDEAVETYCTLFKTTAPMLTVKHAKQTAHYYKTVEALYNDPRLVKRTHFLILDVIESSERLLSLVGERPTRKDKQIQLADVLASPAKSKFKGNVTCKPRNLDYETVPMEPVTETSEESPSKKRLSEEAKVRLRQDEFTRAVRTAVKSHALKVGVETLQELCSKYMAVRSEVVHQICKYAVLELSAAEQPVVAELISMSAGVLSREAVTAGISHTFEGVSDLRLDNPMAEKYLATIAECLGVHSTG